jgi:hypothetical protein
MNRIITNSSLILLGAIFLCSFLFKQDDLIGQWRNERYGFEVRIFKQNELYFGHVTDAGNEKGNEKIKKGPMEVLKNFKQTSDSTYCCGQLFIPKFNTSIPANINLTNSQNLTVIGYLFGIKTTSHWKKIK